jgi:FkbM family methyltransferase
MDPSPVSHFGDDRSSVQRTSWPLRGALLTTTGTTGRVTRASQLVNGLLGRVGWRLQRLPQNGVGGARARQLYYKPTPTCQISELATLYSLYLGERSDGLFVEVGAFDGISFSNSSCLAEVGWSGILIEPIPSFADECRTRYRGNDRIQIVEAAVGAENSTVEISVGGPFTSTNDEVVTRYHSLKWSKAAVQGATRLIVRQLTLDEILHAVNLAGNSIDVLIVDVEGAETGVFQGFSIDRWRPKLIIAELSHTHPDFHDISWKDAVLQQKIVQAGYIVVYKDYINTVFARADIHVRPPLPPDRSRQPPPPIA